jgi:O-antigen ligase/tetratricopeptide (TPR) repeat protein
MDKKQYKEKNTKNLKYAIFIGLGLLLATPFIVSNGLFFPYITGKAYFFRIVVEIIFGLWLILAISDKNYRPQKSSVLYGILAFLISIFISNIFGENSHFSFWSNFERMEGYVTLIHLFALFLVMSSVIRNQKDWLYVFNGIFIASTISVVQAFFQVAGESINFRVATTLGNPTYLAVYMLISFFVSLYLISWIDFSKYRKLSHNWQLWLYSVVAFAQAFLVFQTGTRGAMLGLIVGLIIIFVSYLIFSKNKKLKKVSISGIILIVVLASLIVGFKNTSLAQEFVGFKRLSTISLTEGTSEARLINWSMALEAFAEKPVLGWGQGNYNLAFDKYYKPEMHGNEVWFDRTHNIVLDWLIAGGILGALFYISIWLAVVYLLIFKTKSESVASKSILLAMLAAYFVHNLFVFDNIISYILFFVIISYVHSQNSFDIKFFNRDVSEIFSKTLISLIIIAIPITVYGLNYQSYMANKDLVSGMRIVKQIKKEDGTTASTYKYEDKFNGNLNYFLSALSRDTFANPEIRQRMLLTADNILQLKDDSEDVAEMKQLFLETALAEMTEQIKETPNDARYPYLLGTMLARIGEVGLAEKYLLNVIDLSPEKQATRLHLIALYRNSKQEEKALKLAKETYELDTSHDDLWVEYAITASVFRPELFKQLKDQAIESGNFNRVEDLIKRGIEADPDNIQNHVSLAAFYNEIGDKEKALAKLDEIAEKFPEAASQALDFKNLVKTQSESQ